LVQQPGVAEERRDLVVRSERLLHGFEALVDLFLRLGERHTVKRQRMAEAVRSDGVAGFRNLAHPLGVGGSHLAYHEIRGLDALRREDLQDMLGVRGQGTIVEGQHHLMIGERQGVVITHGADQRHRGRIDHQGSVDPECVGVRTFFRRGASTHGHRQSGREQREGAQAAHLYSPYERQMYAAIPCGD
jgi:hypothetical protein